jgi:uncharacterized membrane protein YeiH
VAIRRPPIIEVIDAMGLALFCVTGARKALNFGLGSAQAVILGAITGIGGGSSFACAPRGVLWSRVPLGRLLRQSDPP